MRKALSCLTRRSYVSIAILLTVCVGGVWALAARQRDNSPPQKTAPRARVDRRPVRGEPGPLRLHLSADFAFECTRCHRPGRSAAAEAKELGIDGKTPRGAGDDFPSMPLFYGGTFPHAALILDHGRNDQCFDCHNKDKRDTYLANDGTAIPSDKSERLCSKCHGPRYRDWLMGMHGKRLGYWNPKMGESHDLVCIQCHNPHSPRFGKLKPMPGPWHEDVHTEHTKKGDA